MSSPIPTDPTRSPIPGGLAGLRLTEPVRLYLYGVGLVLVAGLVLAGAVTGEWSDYLGTLLGVVLVVPLGTEAARASVYSPVSAMAAVRGAIEQERAAR